MCYIIRFVFFYLKYSLNKMSFHQIILKNVSPFPQKYVEAATIISEGSCDIEEEKKNCFDQRNKLHFTMYSNININIFFLL